MAEPNQPSVNGHTPPAGDVSWEDAFREMPGAGDGADAPAVPPESARAPRPEAAAPKATAIGAREGVDMDFLLDIPLEVTVEVGRTKMLVNDLLQLQQGSVIDLEKMVGEPFEVYVNKKLMAYGEVVVVNEKFGIRLTDIIEPKERIQQLG